MPDDKKYYYVIVNFWVRITLKLYAGTAAVGGGRRRPVPVRYVTTRVSHFQFKIIRDSNFAFTTFINYTHQGMRHSLKGHEKSIGKNYITFSTYALIEFSSNL